MYVSPSGSSSSSSSSSSSYRGALSLQPSRFSASSEKTWPSGVSAALSLQRELPTEQKRIYDSLKQHKLYVISGSFQREIEISDETVEKVSLKASQILHEKGIDSRGKEITVDLTGQRIKLSSKDPTTGLETAEHIPLSFADLQEEIEAVQKESPFTARKCSSILKGDQKEPFALRIFSKELGKTVNSALREKGGEGLLKEILSKTNFTTAQKKDRLARFQSLGKERHAFIEAIEKKKEAIEKEIVVPGTPAYEQKMQKLQEMEAFLGRVKKTDVFALMLVVIVEEIPSLDKKQELLEKIIRSFLGGKDPKSLSSQDREYIKDILAISLNRAEAEDALSTYRKESIEEFLYRRAFVEKRGEERVPFTDYVRAHTEQFFTDPSKEIVEFFAKKYEEDDDIFVTPKSSPRDLSSEVSLSSSESSDEESIASSDLPLLDEMD